MSSCPDEISRHLPSFSTRNPEQAGRSAIALAAALIERAKKLTSAKVRKRSNWFARVMDNEDGRRMALALAEQIGNPGFRANPAFIPEPPVDSDLSQLLSPLERMRARFLPKSANWTTKKIYGNIAKLIQRENAALMRSAAPPVLHAHLEQRSREGIGTDVILCGEADGGMEAAHRMESLVKLLADPMVGRVSVHLPGILPPSVPLAFGQRVTDMVERLRVLFRAALRHAVPDEGGGKRAKFITLEARGHADQDLLMEAFQRALEDPEFLNLEAGLVLQACYPESLRLQAQLLEWAARRFSEGGAPVTIRLVKGAMHAIEKDSDALQAWPNASFPTRLGTDTNFKQMIAAALRPETAAAIRLGVATHNPFDIAFALLLARHNKVEDHVTIEMCEGAANPLAMAVRDIAGKVRLYVPTAHRGDSVAAFWHFMRHLREFADPQSIARNLHRMHPGNETWTRQTTHFLSACRDAFHEAGTRSYDEQDRSTPEGRAAYCPADGPFRKEPDTDWSRASNRLWIRAVITDARETDATRIPLVIGGGEILEGSRVLQCIDPSRPGRTLCHFTSANEEQVETAIECARKSVTKWSAVPHEERRALLVAAANEIAAARGEAIAALVLNAGKTIPEADAEVSLAIDAANLCARAFDNQADLADIAPNPLGPVSVITSVLSPFATPCESILAALMAGNPVLFKPADHTVPCAWMLCSLLWKAGIPRDVLQFVPASEKHIRSKLTTSPKIKAALFSGKRETAGKILKWRKSLRLHASATARNSMIITRTADPARAARDLVRSAFTNSGQDPLAVPLAIVEAGLYENPDFRKHLLDMASSLPAGPAWDPATVITPLPDQLSRDVERALTRLDAGEEWLLKPREISPSPFLWTPGIRFGVRPGSWFHLVDCPGPVLGVMRAESLDHAIEIQNSGPHGLAAGLHSRDRAEITRWSEAVQAATLFVNRPSRSTRAGRQPLGGWKKSVIGPMTMRGGPNLVYSLCGWEQMDVPAQKHTLPAEIVETLSYADRWLKAEIERAIVHAAAHSYQHFNGSVFRKTHDLSGIESERNQFHYLPLPRGVLVRLGREPDPTTLCGVVLASLVTGVEIEVSMHAQSGFADALGLPAVIEAEETLAARITKGKVVRDRIRAPHGASELLAEAAAEAGIPLEQDPILANGRIELLHYHLEQSIAESNLPTRWH